MQAIVIASLIFQREISTTRILYRVMAWFLLLTNSSQKTFSISTPTLIVYMNFIHCPLRTNPLTITHATSEHTKVLAVWEQANLQHGNRSYEWYQVPKEATFPIVLVRIPEYGAKWKLHAHTHTPMHPFCGGEKSAWVSNPMFPFTNSFFTYLSCYALFVKSKCVFSTNEKTRGKDKVWNLQILICHHLAENPLSTPYFISHFTKHQRLISCCISRKL